MISFERWLLRFLLALSLSFVWTTLLSLFNCDWLYHIYSSTPLTHLLMVNILETIRLPQVYVFFNKILGWWTYHLFLRTWVSRWTGNFFWLVLDKWRLFFTQLVVVFGLNPRRKLITMIELPEKAQHKLFLTWKTFRSIWNSWLTRLYVELIISKGEYKWLLMSLSLHSNLISLNK